MIKLLKFDFIIKYTPGIKNLVDAPSRRSDYRDVKNNDDTSDKFNLNLVKSITISFKNLLNDLRRGFEVYDPALGNVDEILVTAISIELKDDLFNAQEDNEFV